MSDDILCHDCGHDIDDHGSAICTGCLWGDDDEADCSATSSVIARAYAEERWLDGVDVGYVLGRFHSKRDEKGHRE